MGPFYSLASSYFFGIGLSSDERCHCGPVRHEGKVNLETLQLIHGTTEGPPGGPGPVFPSDQSIHMWPRVWRTTPPCSMKPDVARKPKRWKLAPWLSGQGTLRKIRLSDGPYVRFWIKADVKGPFSDIRFAPDIGHSGLLCASSAKKNQTEPLPSSSLPG